jgi:putative FmdB family regulatory protein
MYVMRTYHCDDCSSEFEVMEDRDADSEAACPTCTGVPVRMPSAPKIRAADTGRIDSVQRQLSTEFGLADFNVTQREGDAAVTLPPAAQKMVDLAGGSMFGSASRPSAISALESLKGAGKKNPEASPVRQLHKAIKAAPNRDPLRSAKIVAKAN